MSDFLQTMAVGSAERAAAVPLNFSSADFDKPVVLLLPGGFDVIAEIKDRSPAEANFDSPQVTVLRRHKAMRRVAQSRFPF